MNTSPTRFVTAENWIVEDSAWGPHEWMCRPDIVEAEKLMLVRVRMPPGKGHPFHRHPPMEEIIYVEEGLAEQWVDQQMRILRPGESAHIPADMVHATFNAGDSTLVFLAILSPAKFTGYGLVDMAKDEPWKSLLEQRAARSA